MLNIINTIAIGVQTTASGSNSTVLVALLKLLVLLVLHTVPNLMLKVLVQQQLVQVLPLMVMVQSALGRAASAKAESATALGRNAEATIAGGVALGFESKTTVAAGVQGYNPATGRTRKYSDQGGAVGTSTLAAVSIGVDSTKTRQLTGLAAGLLTLMQLT